MTRARPASLLDRLFALRPLLWIPAIALFEAGRTTFDRGAPAPAAVAALVSLLGILSAVHVANGWRDRAGDRLNRKGGALAAGAIAAGGVVTLAVASLAVAVLAARWARLGAAPVMLLGGAGALGLIYTLPPVETKRRAGLDLVTQALGYGVVGFALGAAITGASPAAAARASIPFALGIATVGLLTMLADRSGDETVGQRTTAVALGEDRAASLAIVLAALTAGSGLALGAWAPALWGVIATGWLGLNAARDWNRAAIALQVLFLLLLTPFTIVPLAAALLLALVTAAYDRGRGGAGYPLRSEGRDAAAMARS